MLNKYFDSLKKRNLRLVVLVFIIAYFIIRGVYFAVNIKEGVAPDENHHIGVIEEYKDSTLIPENHQGSYRFGPLNNNPYLYYILMAKLSTLNISPMNDVIFLRLINLLFSVVTLLFAYKITGLVTKSRLTKLMVVGLISNTAMFSFLSAAVNYDNFVNMLAAISIYYILLFTQGKRLIHLLVGGIAVNLGLLSKISFMPLAVVLFIVLLIELTSMVIRKRKQINLNLIWQIKPLYIFATLIALISLVMVFELYGLNVAQYKDITPGCDKVLTHEQCLNNPVYKRSIDTKLDAKPVELVNPIEYFARWNLYMQERSLGVMGHLGMVKTAKELIPYNLIALASLLLYIRYYKKTLKSKRTFFYMVGIVLFYTFVLGLYQNYRTYANTGEIGRALQGRYIFPVLPLIYILLLYPFGEYLSRRYKIVAFTIISIIFFLGDFPYFLRGDSEAWYKK